MTPGNRFRTGESRRKRLPMESNRVEYSSMTLFRPADWAALGAIYLYQTIVSPRKGFRCAYSVVYGGTGCSGYVKQIIRQEGLFAACRRSSNGLTIAAMPRACCASTSIASRDATDCRVVIPAAAVPRPTVAGGAHRVPVTAWAASLTCFLDRTRKTPRSLRMNTIVRPEVVNLEHCCWSIEI